MTPELTALVSRLPLSRLADPTLLDEAGSRMRIAWPGDYAAVITDHNGAEGEVGGWNLVLTRVEDLVDQNSNDVMTFLPDLVVIGGDGGGEALAIHRATGEVLLVPWIGTQDDWLVLGLTFTEALHRMERGEVFDAPKWRPPHVTLTDAD